MKEVEVTLKSFLADRSLLYNKTFVCFYDFSGQIQKSLISFISVVVSYGRIVY